METYERMKVVSSCGGGSVYLVMVGEDPITAQGFIVNTEENRRYPPERLQTIYGQGYWERCEHSDELLQRLMAIPEVKME